nr:isoprenyl transferase [Bacillota bacterium]
MKEEYVNGGKAMEHPSEMNSAVIPQHVAIIMDGNGRWAKKRGLPRVAGHRAGMERVKEITQACDEIGVRYLTLYAFSTENWKRPPEEVNFLMRLPEEFLRRELGELVKKNVRLQLLGDERDLPEHTRRAIQEGIDATRENTGLVLSFAVNYGGRAELLKAVSQMLQEVKAGTLDVTEVTEEDIQKRLYTACLPDPDLLIRTSGELRISNFLLWQIAYTELYFTNVCWPDFTREDLLEAIASYQRRVRRYGMVK